MEKRFKWNYDENFKCKLVSPWYSVLFCNIFTQKIYKQLAITISPNLCC